MERESLHTLVYISYTWSDVNTRCGKLDSRDDTGGKLGDRPEGSGSRWQAVERLIEASGKLGIGRQRWHCWQSCNICQTSRRTLFIIPKINKSTCTHNPRSIIKYSRIKLLNSSLKRRGSINYFKLVLWFKNA